MFPFSDSSSPMDLPLYQQLQLSPPSPKPDQSSSFFYYPCSPPFAAADASFHLGCGVGGAAAADATPPQDVIESPGLPVHPVVSMEQAPAPEPEPGPDAGNAQGAGGSLDRSAARKDRHSKICTAGGMRDRRMRLSLDVARKFFALQDMLGFDKASKTVQWLLNTSKAAIQEIMTDDASSECVEDGSSSLSVDGKHNPPAAELQPGGDQQPKPASGGRGEGKKPARARKAAATPKPPRKSGGAHAHPVPDKETRAKARERARERTKEKHRMRWVKLASAIDVEAAARDRPGSSNLIHHHSSSMNMPSAAAELEERCSSSTLNNGGRMQEMSEASDVILAFGNGGYGGGGGGGSNYYCQEQWELGGVVFQNSSSRFY